MDQLVSRLRGKYPVGPILANGQPEFGYRDMFGPAGIKAPFIDLEAADRIEALEKQVAELQAADKPDSADTKRLDALERACQTGNHLSYHKKRFALRGFTNYEFDVFASLRDAIDSFIKSKEPVNG